MLSNCSTVYWNNTTVGLNFYARTINLPKPCKKVCVIWGNNNTAINIDTGIATTQYPDAGMQLKGSIIIERGQTVNADATYESRGYRPYTLSADGTSITVGAATYQQGYQTPCLIFSLE